MFDEVRGHSGDGERLILSLPMRLQTPDTGGAARQYVNLVADGEAASGEGARHDRARPADGEDPVDEEPGPGVGRSLDTCQQFAQRCPDLLDPVARRRCDRDDRRVLQARAGDPLGHVVDRHLEGLLIDDVGLRHRDHASLDAQHVEDLQMLLGLRLPPLVGGHHEQDEPHRTDAGEHVRDEALVTGNVDEPHVAAARQFAPGVPEVDRETPPLLLGEPIRVHAGEGGDQRRLAVVDVAGGGDHPELAHVSPRRGRRPRGHRRWPGRAVAPRRGPRCVRRTTPSRTRPGT